MPRLTRLLALTRLTWLPWAALPGEDDVDQDLPTNARLLESGDYRLLEDGSYRLLEAD